MDFGHNNRMVSRFPFKNVPDACAMNVSERCLAVMGARQSWSVGGAEFPN